MPFADRSPLLRAERERIAAERMAAQVEIERIYRWEFVRVIVECTGWCLAGGFLLMLACHMTDAFVAEIPWFGGFLAGYGGISFSLITAYGRGVGRGDW